MNRGWLIAGMGVVTSLSLAEGVLAQSASEYRQLGLSLREQERYPEAIAVLKKSVELDPENLSGRVLLGWTEHKAGQQTDATNTLVASMRLNPFDVPTLNALGIVYLVSGQLNAAITTHGWAAMLKPDNEIAHYNLSLAFERIRQYDWAIATAQEAAKLEPTNPHPLIALAIAHWGNSESNLAKQAFQQAVSIDSRYGDAEFLSYLDEAGFSADQIQRSRLVLESAR
jgi:Flp pilus assembly protein TadD